MSLQRRLPLSTIFFSRASDKGYRDFKGVEGKQIVYERAEEGALKFAEEVLGTRSKREMSIDELANSLVNLRIAASKNEAIEVVVPSARGHIFVYGYSEPLRAMYFTIEEIQGRDKVYRVEKGNDFLLESKHSDGLSQTTHK